ncbi:ankyrin repeat-containing domain protein [Xylariales sp. PMI_506]|nr:ankyrin repeat-containing domain protein [Xylariales sp. PMI_506]
MFRLIEEGNLDGVKKSLEAGNPVNGYSAAGLTALGAAIVHSQLCQDKSFLQSTLPAVCPSIHCAAALGSANLIRLLVDSGADVNDPSGIDYGSQVLPLFVATGQATKALIDLGADVSRKNASGFTPLVHAMAREDISSSRLLVAHGADVEVERIARYRIKVSSTDGTTDTEGQIVEGTSSPLMVASHQGRLRPTSGDMFEILASGGADINRRYHIRNAGYDIRFTVLSLICGSRVPSPELKGQYAKQDQYGQKEVAAIKALIYAGVNVNDPPVTHYLCQGEMPFQDFGPRLEVLELLIQRGGAQVNPPSGLTPQSALLKSFRKQAEAQIQFASMAAALDRAGAKWDLSGVDEHAAIPEYFGQAGDVAR